MQHSKIVGGSTAKRVMACPGSVALVAKMPPQVENKYMADGTALHSAVDLLVNDGDASAYSLLGKTFNGIVLDDDHCEKLKSALALLNEVDPKEEMNFATETRVGFGDLLPGVFGSTDLIGRIGNRAIVLDWKFGDGVIVDAEENAQLMFYAAAAMRTPESAWAFEGATEVECVIIQPPSVRRWVTTPERIRQFERDLVQAVKLSSFPDAQLTVGDHCRFCTAKPICPQMTGAADRALAVKLDNLDAGKISTYLKNADLLETWISSLRELALSMMESGAKLPEYKLVAKRAIRQWTDEDKAKVALFALGLDESEVMETSIMSPAKVEKVLKKRKIALPSDVVVAISSGNTLASADDPRPEVILLGKQLTAALSKLQ
jgi:hypothetical protein